MLVSDNFSNFKINEATNNKGRDLNESTATHWKRGVNELFRMVFSW